MGRFKLKLKKGVHHSKKFQEYCFIHIRGRPSYETGFSPDGHNLYIYTYILIRITPKTNIPSLVIGIRRYTMIYYRIQI